MKRYFTVLMMIGLLISCKEDDSFSGNDTNFGGILNKRGIGESAFELLSNDEYKHLEIELLYVEGFSPTQSALDQVKLFLASRLNKSKGISFKFSAVATPNLSHYSIQDLVEIEGDHRSVYSRSDTLGAYLFFADAGFSENDDDSKVLGVAYRNTSMAIFEKTIRDLSGGLNQPQTSTLETVVIKHEFCHNLGLVNAGSAMQVFHQDEVNGRHCDNKNCLMHFSVETGNVLTNTLGGDAPELDENCINDLRANGGK